jgi:hypothetical protein
VVLFSEGFIQDNLSRELEVVAAAAAQSYCVFYTMDLNARSQPLNQAYTPDTTLATEIQARIAPMATLAVETGGEMFVDAASRTDDVLNQLADQAQDYYLVGFTPSDSARSNRGQYRRVKVELAGSRSATLSYRQGYFAAKDYRRFNAFEKEQQLSEALAFDDPITEIPMAAEVNYFRIGAAEYFVPISVRMPGSQLAQVKSDGSLRAEIDFIGEIKDEHGTTLRNMRDRVEFSSGPGGDETKT